MQSLRKFTLGFAACFGLPWFVLVVSPYMKERRRDAVPYTDASTHPDAKTFDTEFYDNTALKGVVYPAAAVQNHDRGSEVYARLGCAQCHTQVIRPDWISVDQYEKFAGRSQDAKAQEPTRPSTPWDYLREDFGMIGQRRIGPDLANAGYRYKTATEFLSRLYAPRATKAWSNHPLYHSLFETKPIESAVRQDAVKFDIVAGTQVVPTMEAKTLADYVLNLKRDQDLPVSITGKTMADVAKK
jgi:cytochrome c oxidase cbb3-type subunit II